MVPKAKKHSDKRKHKARAKYYSQSSSSEEDEFSASTRKPTIPQHIVKELEYQSRQNLSTINFTATFARTASSCNTVMEKCLHSAKATFKRVRNQILKGADPERTARRGYEDACDYFDLMNKRILIQQRALACLSKSVTHILQRELYTMGNTGLLRREAEMTHI